MASPPKLPITLKDVQETVSVCLKPDQETAIEKLCEGKDVIVTLPTGYGKSLIFLSVLKTLLNKEIGFLAMLVTPLIGLSENHKISLEKMGIPYFDINAVEGDKDASVIISNPEGFLSDTGIKLIKEKQCLINILIVDEVHTLYLWGLSQNEEEVAFRADFAKLTKVTGRLRVKPLILTLTATIAPEHRATVVKMLGIRVDNSDSYFSIERTPLSPRISFLNRRGKINIENIGNLMLEKGQNCPRIVIFMKRLDDCGDMWEDLMKVIGEENGHMLQAMTGQTSPSIKKDTVRRLSREEDNLKVVICTSVLSMGVDMTDVEYVIIDKLPVTMEQFLQMAGRSGRSDSKRAVCITTGRSQRNASSVNKLFLRNTEECRRVVISRCFQGEPMLHNNKYNFGCCDVCGGPQEDKTAQLLVTPSAPHVPPFHLCKPVRQVKPIDKDDFRSALIEIRDDVLATEYANLPIAYTGLSSRRNRELLVKHMKHIKSVDDVLHVLPYLKRELARRVLVTLSELFEDEDFVIEQIKAREEPLKFPGDSCYDSISTEVVSEDTVDTDLVELDPMFSYDDDDEEFDIELMDWI